MNTVNRVVISTNGTNIIMKLNRSKSVEASQPILKQRKCKPFCLSSKSKSFMDKFSAKRLEASINNIIKDIYRKILDQYNGENKLQDICEYLDYFGYDRIMHKPKEDKYIDDTVAFEIEQIRMLFNIILIMVNNDVKSRFLQHRKIHESLITDIVKYLCNDFDEASHVVVPMSKIYRNAEVQTDNDYIPKFKIHGWDNPKREAVEDYVNNKLINKHIKTDIDTQTIVWCCESIAAAILENIFNEKPKYTRNGCICNEYRDFGIYQPWEGRHIWSRGKDGHVIEQILAYIIQVNNMPLPRT